MSTLYDVLGLSQTATPAQIKAAYRLALEDLNKPTAADADADLTQIRAKAIGEAWGVLSSPQRREAYDARLIAKRAGPVVIPVEPTRPLPWFTIGAIVIAFALSFTWYKVQARRAETARVAAEAEKASAAAAEAARVAEAEESRLARQVLADRARADAQRAREASMARSEWRPSRYEREVYVVNEERKREHDLARAKAEQRQEEMMAQQRADRQLYNMQRALDIPIVKH